MDNLDAQVAERVMGWTIEQRYSDGILGWRAPGFPLNRAYTGKRAGSPWSPSTDIVAARLMETAIEQQGREAQRAYVNALMDIIDAVPFDDALWVWQAMRATPEQRCHAALLAVTAAREGEETMHPNLGRFVIEKPGIDGAPVFLYAPAYRDGSGEWRRNWVTTQEDAQVFKLRANADKAAARWGGIVKRIEEN